MRALATVAGVELRRFLRDRSNLFFVFIFPLLLVVLIGAQFGEGANTGRVLVTGPDGDLRQSLVEQLEDEGLLVSSPAWDDALQRLARGRADVAVRVDDAASRAHDAGEEVRLEMVRGSANRAQIVEQYVQGAVQSLSTRDGQVSALEARGLAPAQARSALGDAALVVETAEIEIVRTDELSEEFAGLGQFDFGASGQLLLFVFLNSLAAASTLIQARRWGVISRILSMPVSTAQVIGGVTLGRWTIALFQGAYIMAATSLLFGVSWGSIGPALTVVLLFSLVSAGAAMLLGTLLENEGAAVGLGIGLGLVLAALGGSMMPLEFFPDTMRTISAFTPHAWAYEAFADLQRRDGTLVDILPQLGVLAAMAAVLLALGAWTLRRSLERAI